MGRATSAIAPSEALGCLRVAVRDYAKAGDGAAVVDSAVMLVESLKPDQVRMLKQGAVSTQVAMRDFQEHPALRQFDLSNTDFLQIALQRRQLTPEERREIRRIKKLAELSHADGLQALWCLYQSATEALPEGEPLADTMPCTEAEWRGGMALRELRKPAARRRLLEAASALISGTAPPAASPSSKVYKDSREEASTKWRAHALTILHRHPGYTKKQIAKMVGVHPSQFTEERFPEFAAAQARLAEEGKAARRSGFIVRHSGSKMTDVDSIDGSSDD